MFLSLDIAYQNWSNKMTGETKLPEFLQFFLYITHPHCMGLLQKVNSHLPQSETKYLVSHLFKT